MRIRGNGSVKQVMSNGKPVKNSWQLVLSLGKDPLTGKRVQRYRPYKGSRSSAVRALADWRREIESGLKLDAGDTLFGQYARQQWLEPREASGRFAPATILRNRQLLNHLLRYLESVRVTDIDATVVRNLYVELAQDDVGQYSIAKAAIVLKQILKQAVSDGIILFNPCERVENPKQPTSDVGMSLDKAGVIRLTEALLDYESMEYPLAKARQSRLTSNMSHVAAIRLIMASGIRRSECLALSWSDIDFTNSTVKVSKTFCKTTKELKSTKSSSSVRLITVDADSLESLDEWRQRQADYLISIGITQDSETPVITNEVGTRLNGDNLARWWRSFCKRYEFEGLRIHDLRHTHISLLISSGLNMKAASVRAGHASVAFTMDRYAHALREDDEKAAAIIGKYMARPVPKAG
ncbi:MAG: site-specific integrase [Coriobacteriia bacterium]|nr:site-specific integrase [Coriobacteriia bacterium]